MLRPGATETAQFLLGEAKESFQRTAARADRFEAKATTLLGIVAGASGALGAFGLSRAPVRMGSPLVVVALGAITVAMLAALHLLRSKRRIDVDMTPFFSTKIAESDNRFALALTMAQLYGDMTNDLRFELKNDWRILLAAYGATAVAAVLLIANVLYGTPDFRAMARHGSSYLPAKLTNTQHTDDECMRNVGKRATRST